MREGLGGTVLRYKHLALERDEDCCIVEMRIR